MTTPYVAHSLIEAMSVIDTLPISMPAVHTFPLTRVMGRVLAQNFYAPFAVPGFVRSRLDGFAVRVEDLQAATPDAPVGLRVIATAPAGTWPVPPVQAGQCVRIMTGAPMPEGATAVVGFEDAKVEKDMALVSAPVQEGYGVGQPNVNAEEGELLAGRGTRVDAVLCGRLASIGTINVPVFSRPRVAVLSTGSELLISGMPPSPGKIYNSGQSILCSLLYSAGAIPLPCGIARDDVNAIAETMVLALRDNTMLVTTGGVGHGDYDCIRAAMEKAGAQVLLGGGEFKPGGTFALASLNGKYILSLSGSPGSALIIMHLLGLPLVRRLTFDSNWQVREVEVILATLPKKKPQGLLTGHLSLEGGKALFRPMAMGELERRPMDLVIPLSGYEDLETIWAEQRPMPAFYCPVSNVQA